MYFLRGSFWVPGQLLAALGGKRGPQSGVKVMIKRVGVQDVKHVKNVAGTVREAYEDSSGKGQDALYWDWRRKALSMQLPRRRRDAFL
jgi:hypothetical protein